MNSRPRFLKYLLVLGVMLLWRLAPKGGWISRWPLAFFIGATAGFRLIGYMEADFVAPPMKIVRSRTACTKDDGAVVGHGDIRSIRAVSIAAEQIVPGVVDRLAARGGHRGRSEERQLFFG